MSTATPAIPLQPLRPSELASAGQTRLAWLWHGFLAPGKVTALISPSKTGKTTLLSHLLARFAPAPQPVSTEERKGVGVRAGQLAGLALAPGRALVVSEEATDDWDARCRQLGIGQHVQFLCRPFQGARPTEAQWFALLAGLEALHRQEALDLVVIDPLSTLLPGYAETCAPKLLDCLLPLQPLAKQGLAVWLMHHPGRGKRIDGQASRGSSALSGFVDVMMEMSCYRRARSRDRRRRICAYSRYAETPRHLLLELNSEGTDYLVRTDAAGTPIGPIRPELQSVLENVLEKLSLEQILEHWPAEEARPNNSTLSRWLKRATEQSVIRCSGSGIRSDPFRYWLPEREGLLRPADNASEEEMQAWQDRYAAHVSELLGLTDSP